MAAFDFVESASEGYKFAWKGRQHLIRLAGLPVILKVITFAFIILFGLEDEFLLYGLLFLPSYFAEGWFIAQVLRIYLLGECWSGWLTSGYKDSPDFGVNRRRCLLSSTIIYVMVKLAVAFMSGMTIAGANMEGGQATVPSVPPDPSTPLLLAVMIVFGISIWAFRFLWLYIPAVMDYSLSDFLKKISSFMTSVYMLGLWMLCTVPVTIAVILTAKILALAFPGNGETVPGMYTYSIAMVQSVAELVVAIVSSIAMAYAIRSIIEGNNKPTPIL